MTLNETMTVRLIEATEAATRAGMDQAYENGVASLSSYLGAQHAVVAVLRELAAGGSGVLLDAHALNKMADDIEQR